MEGVGALDTSRILRSIKHDARLFSRHPDLPIMFAIQIVAFNTIFVLFLIALVRLNLFLSMWFVPLGFSVLPCGYVRLFIYDGREAVKALIESGRLRDRLFERYVWIAMWRVGSYLVAMLVTRPIMVSALYEYVPPRFKHIPFYIPSPHVVAMIIACCMLIHVWDYYLYCYHFRTLIFPGEGERFNYLSIGEKYIDQKSHAIDMGIHWLLQSFFPQIIIMAMMLGSWGNEWPFYLMAPAARILLQDLILPMAALTLNLVNTWYFRRKSREALENLNLAKMNLI